jgi:hypothetical protein
MNLQTTWQPLAAPYDINDNGTLAPRERRALPDSAFAFPYHRELPLVDEELTRAAIAELSQLGQVYRVSDEERSLAANNIRAAAHHFGLPVPELAL